QRGGDNLHAGEAVGHERLPVVNVQTVQVADGVQYGVDRLGFSDKRDHAGVEIQIGQQDPLIHAAELGGDVTHQSGGAAAALGGQETERLAAALGTLAPPTAFHAAPFERLPERIVQRRIQILVDAGAQRREN